MNANLGIILRKQDRESILAPLAPRRRTWGGEVVEEENSQRFAAIGLDDIEFELFPITKFVSDRLPTAELTQKLEYAWMIGGALDAYELWARKNAAFATWSSLESQLLALLDRLNFWAVMFAPEGDRLGSVVAGDAGDAIRMLRSGVSDVSTSGGFLVIRS